MVKIGTATTLVFVLTVWSVSLKTKSIVLRESILQNGHSVRTPSFGLSSLKDFCWTLWLKKEILLFLEAFQRDGTSSPGGNVEQKHHQRNFGEPLSQIVDQMDESVRVIIIVLVRKHSMRKLKEGI